jgi:hypothetical protein
VAIVLKIAKGGMVVKMVEVVKEPKVMKRLKPW